ncbi:MAG: exodeoxyribonuclease VII small subunit [Lachnospiraceae bacterium]|nr:exodeoxyribonuclease VII small subunit [Lachnospiraceae bacterium]
MENDKTLEEMMQELEECTVRIEAGEMSLEESFEAFKSGMELVKQCNESIDKVEKQVMMLMDDGTVEPLDKE